MSNFGIPQHWFELAEYDIQTARAMLETKRYLYVGFMCHMAVEKALKGVFVSKYSEDALPYTHRLIHLLNLIQLSNEISDEHRHLIEMLGPLNIEARYPHERIALLTSLTPKTCRDMIRQTEEVYQWLMSKR